LKVAENGQKKDLFEQNVLDGLYHRFQAIRT